VALIAVAALGVFLAGLVVGLVIGLVVVPMARFWLAWTEWREASRQARFTEPTLKRMDEGPWRLLVNREPASAGRTRRHPGTP
jgi:hypothetical protein